MSPKNNGIGPGSQRGTVTVATQWEQAERAVPVGWVEPRRHGNHSMRPMRPGARSVDAGSQFTRLRHPSRVPTGVRSIEQRVRQQYEAYPYPLRSPSDDISDAGDLSPLEDARLINHYGFQGRREWSRPFRVLVAGGGTGDATTELGRQFKERGIPGEIVYIDLSSAARNAAMERARALGLDNIEFLQGSLLDLPSMALGKFDYINCSGVLHHLENPGAGAAALEKVLADDGCMGVMLYGELGRIGVYHVQEILRTLTDDCADQDKLALARRVLSRLPNFNWLNKNDQLRWHEAIDDVEVFDRFLHCCDKPFRVPSAVRLMADVGLRVVEFMPPILYQPQTYVADPVLLRKIGRKDKFEQYSIAELVCGFLSKLSFFAVKQNNAIDTEAKPGESDMVPLLLISTSGQGLARELRETHSLSVTVSSVALKQPMILSRLAERILECIDSVSTLAQIYQQVSGVGPVDWQQFMGAFMSIYRPLNQISAMALTTGASASASPTMSRCQQTIPSFDHCSAQPIAPA